MCLLALLWLWLAPALSLGDHRLSPSLTQPRAAAGLGQGLLCTAPVCQDRLLHQHRHQSFVVSQGRAPHHPQLSPAQGTQGRHQQH